MVGSTHFAAGMVLATFIPEPSLQATAAVVIGALLPDVDSKSSFVGRYVPMIPALLKHRGVTHYPVLAFIVSFFNFPLALGMASHIALDMLNPDGIPIFGPLYKKKICLPLIRHLFPNGGTLDKMLAFLLWGIALYRFAALALFR